MTTPMLPSTPRPRAARLHLRRLLLPLLALAGCMSAQQRQAETLARQQPVQVRPLDTADAVTFGVEGPLAPYAESIAAAMVRSMRNEKLDASVLAAGAKPSAGLVVEPRLVVLNAGGDEQLRAAGFYGPGGIRVVVEGRVTSSDGRLLGEFHAADATRSSGSRRAGQLVDECAFNVGTDVAYIVLTNGYNGLDPAVAATARRDRELADQARARVERITVTPGELNGGHYDVLGQIDWPQKDDLRYQSADCDPARIRLVAYERYRGAASGVVHFRTWPDAGTLHCSGTVVKYSERTAG